MAQQCRECYCDHREDPDQLPMAKIIPHILLPLLGIGAKNRPSSAVIFSSLGIIERNLSGHAGAHGTATDFWLSVDLIGPSTALHFWTEVGKMTLNLSYNETCYKDAEMQNYLQTLENVLLQGLGLV
jgi:hypothetical protein